MISFAAVDPDLTLPFAKTYLYKRYQYLVLPFSRPPSPQKPHSLALTVYRTTVYLTF